MLRQSASHKRGRHGLGIVREIVLHTHARMAFFARLLKVDLQVLPGTMRHTKELIDIELQLGAFFAGTSVL